jgi:DNA modification methylase
VPVDEAPLGWEIETRRHEVKVTKFQHAYPTIRLPFQEVQRVTFGHTDQFSPINRRERERESKEERKLRELFPTGANRLFFGDNLHIMRQLPSESIDLIYIDPPFFSGRNYNVIFGDKNEVRSFSDIWEGGMPGYLVWLNARLFEMKRLLKPTGSIYVHLDWHASHYVKVEMDKIFGADNFQNEIIWHYKRWPTPAREFQKMHDVILCYAKSKGEHVFNRQYGERTEETKKRWKDKRIVAFHDQEGNRIPSGNEETESPGAPLDDVWDISIIAPVSKERIGYPTQKPIEVLQRIIDWTLANSLT